MKNIYKDEVIGDINSNLIYDNEIKGVFGNLKDLVYQGQKILNNTNITDRLYDYSITRASVDRMDSVSSVKFTYNFEMKYATPVDNVNITNVRINIIRKNLAGPDKVHYDNLGIFMDSLPKNGSMLFGNWHPYPNLPNNDIMESQTSGINVSYIQPTKFSIIVTVAVDVSLVGRITRSRIPVEMDAVYTVVGFLYIPQSIQFQINGDEFSIITSQFIYGESQNALEFKDSTLLTSNSTYKNQPLWKHIGQRITNKWYNGKQVVSLPTIINDESDIKEVGEETYIFDVRRGEIDENNQNQINNASIFKTVDGTAKKYIIVNIINNYDGSMNQLLDLQEVT